MFWHLINLQLIFIVLAHIPSLAYLSLNYLPSSTFFGNVSSKMVCYLVQKSTPNVLELVR